MRRLVHLVAAAALVLPTAALAEACPTKADTKFEKSLGTARAWLNDDEPVYTPTRVSKLGATVSYVIVERSLRWNGKSYDNVGIESLRFRLAGVQRPTDGAYPSAIRAAFDDEYAGSGCGAAGADSCAAAGPFGSGVGSLVGAKLNEGDLYIRDTAYGPALDQVRADYLLDAEPAFLVCEYQPEG
jgi:hypothetical protein